MILILPILLLLLLPLPVRAQAPQGKDDGHDKRRGFALFRLPGRVGHACLSCHDAGSLPPAARPDRFRDHVAEHLGRLAPPDLTHLQRYLDERQREVAVATRIEREDLVESLRGLGYVEVHTQRPLPLLRDGMRLNAFELSRQATGSTRLVSTARSPTGQALELREGGLTGIVLPEVGADPGTYVLTLRAAAALGERPCQMLLVARDRPHRAEPVPRGTTPMEATATFRIERAVRLTIAIVPSGSDPFGITELIVARR